MHRICQSSVGWPVLWGLVLASVGTLPPSSAFAQSHDGVVKTEEAELPFVTEAPTPGIVPPDEGGVDPGLLGAWLDYLAVQDKQRRVTGGTSTLIASTALLGFGIWAFLDEPPNNDLNRGVGMLAVAAGGPALALGIVELAMPSASEKRYGRWETAVAAGMTERELARFEGELRSYSLEARRQRMRGRWTGFGLFVTGALLLGLTPVADLDTDAETVGYVTGGVAAGTGLLGFGLSFKDGWEEAYWEAYLQGRPPPGAGPRRSWAVSPALGRSFAGMSLRGAF